ncbi:MAG TPA: hypothetical protein VEJ18_21035 [Planctomycetota bacterium]|nr:hypothetical protein [Planctomycetota bacterium]
MRWFSWASLVVVAGCASGDASGRSASGDAPAGDPEGAILKVAYFRAYAEPRTKRLEPTYKAVMTNSWREKLGESPRDGLVKAAPGKLFLGFLSDAELRKYVRILKDFGLDTLEHVDTDSLNPAELQRLSLDPKETSFTRIITVADEKGSRSYTFKGQPTTDQRAAFIKCEAFVLRIVEYSIHITVGATHRVFPADR